jgi:hypothetical protein
MIMKRIALVSILLLAGVAGAHADYFETTYHDMIRPHGKPRSDAIFQTNLDACYSQTGEHRTLADSPAFKQCMSSRGYRFQTVHNVQTIPTPHVPPGAIGTYTYNDISVGPQRGEAQEQAATWACDGGVSARIGEPAFNACMTRRGWRLAAFDPAPQDSAPTMADDEPAATNDVDDGAATRQAADDLRAIEQSNEAAQQLTNDGLAAMAQAQAAAVNAQVPIQ